MKRQWIDRYVSEVARRLSKNQRTEVSRELESTLLDELEDRSGPNYSEGEVLDLLQEMGPPAAVAASYRASDQYLIGPEWYPTFRKVLLTVFSAHVALVVIASAISIFWSGASAEPGETILYFINAALESAIFAFGLILLIFFLLERSEVQGTKLERAWNPSKLPAAPAPGDMVGKGEALLSVTLLGIFLALLHIFRNSIGLPFTESGRPLLNDVYQHFLPAFSLVLLMDMALNAWLFWRGRWERFSRIAHFAFDLLGLAVAFAFTKAVVESSVDFADTHLAHFAVSNGNKLFWLPASAAVIIAMEHGWVLLKALLRKRKEARRDSL